MIAILKEKANPEQIQTMLEEYGGMIKIVVDIRRGVLAGGGEMTRELMFTWQQDDKLQSKLITNEAAFLAFKEGHQQDTGWLLTGVLRTGSNARGEWSFTWRAHK